MGVEETGIVLEDPPADYVRPVEFGMLGPNSHIARPYRIRSPHRIHIGRDVWIGPGAHLSVVELLKGVEYEPALRIGDRCAIAPDLLVSCFGEISIGELVGIGARVFFGDSFRDYSDPYRMPDEMGYPEPKPIRIGDGAVIATGAVILPGVTVGERAIVSANAVVTRDVPPRAVVFGNPARVIRSWDEQSERWVAGRVS